MPDDLTLADQVRIVRELVAESRVGKAEWTLSGSPGTFKSVRNGTTAILDDTGTTHQPRYRLRFVDDGQPGFAVEMLQQWGDAGFPEEEELDVYLAGLYQVVRGKVARADNPALKYLGKQV